jgi:hypothetical protein
MLGGNRDPSTNMPLLGGTVVSALTGKCRSQAFHLAGMLQTTKMQFFLSCAIFPIASLRHSLGGKTHNSGVPSVGSSMLQGMTNASAPIPSAAGYLVKYLLTLWTCPLCQCNAGLPISGSKRYYGPSEDARWLVRVRNYPCTSGDGCTITLTRQHSWRMGCSYGSPRARVIPAHT